MRRELGCHIYVQSKAVCYVLPFLGYWHFHPKGGLGGQL